MSLEEIIFPLYDVVPKAWIGKEAIVTLKGKESKGKK
jgi:hypothetical protein